MPTLEEAKANTQATIEANRQRIRELEPEVQKLKSIGVDTTALEIELIKAKQRNEKLGQLL